MNESTAPQQGITQIFEQAVDKVLQLALTYQQANQSQDAESLYQAILQTQPNHPEANYNLGLLILQTKRAIDALTYFEAACRAKPEQEQYRLSYIDVLLQSGHAETAQQILERSIQYTDTKTSQLATREITKEQAEPESIKKASSCNGRGIAPEQSEINELVAFYGQGRTTEVEVMARSLSQHFPEYGFGWKILGVVLQHHGCYEEALTALKKAAERLPNDGEVHSNLGFAFNAQGRFIEAEASYRRAVSVAPDSFLAHSNLGYGLLNQGKPAEASFRRALEIKPDFAEAHSNLLFSLSHNEKVDATGLFAEHCRFGEQFEAPIRTCLPQHSNSREPERCLQVGFVSGDLCDHAVANFIEPVLEHLADYSQLALHAYYNHNVEDSVTLCLRKYLKHWHSVVGLADDALAEKIRADGIDILIDLSGHTAKNRLLTFARKPAPVQVSWMGYPGTTGLSAMDYFLADRFLLPSGQFDDQFTEKIVQLPASAPYQPNMEAPLVNALPALSNGYITFGSFNHLRKLGPSVIALWSQLLRALPDSRMVLGGMSEDGQYGVLIDWFAKEGIARERLSFYSRCGLAEYLALHQQVDMCLDTFPYNGGTTTLNALWMGVPTLTLAGETVPSRQGATALGHVGLNAFVAQDTADFVRKGLSWAGHPSSLASIRSRLRERFGQSAIGQPAMVAAGVECALRMMWQRWCAGLPTESFEVKLQNMSKIVDKSMSSKGSQSNKSGSKKSTMKVVSGKKKQNTPDFQELSMLAALNDQNRFIEVEALARSFTTRFPLEGYGWKALGVALQKQGRIAEALAAMQKATDVSPDDAEAHCKLAVYLHQQNRLVEAEASLRRALEIKPDYAEAHSKLGSIFRDQDRLTEAEISLLCALKIDPNQADVQNNLGNVRWRQNRPDQAKTCFLNALAINPKFAEAHNNLGSIFFAQGNLAEAEASFSKAVAISPDFGEAHNNLGYVFLHQRRLPEAQASLQRALELSLDVGEARSSELFYLTHNDTVDATAIFTEHRRFGEEFEAPLRAFWPQHSNSREPGRCLQVGFVSGDFCDHAMANFIEPVLEHLAGYPQLVLHAYYNHSLEDDVTRRLHRYLKHWHPVVGLSHAALAEKIRADGIDILIDLSGHTAKNRLLTFARKPAPLQVSWMGYPGTTGLTAMDYYLADRFLLPPGQFDDQFTEKIVRLPACAPYQPNSAAPPVSALPALSNGYVTFGSFNRQNKLRQSVIGVWSQLLRALPDSRIVLGGMPDDDRYETLIDWFAQEGIAPERLSFHSRCSIPEYFALHQQVDICLDTFPYNGGTTTLNALWMGVPTLTLVGETVTARQGATILGQLGLNAFVAQDAADFVRKGLSWANHPDSLANVRAHLRERLQQSAIGQPSMIAASVEFALRMMWQHWCAGLPAESFEVQP
ncbi:tetratricopeptide repeat protein [Methylobacter sp.]|uniref:tetratricopeptide repeat protein n=1 Tax=Methylobacter sp. TaxID=2051955 RepID=UPI002FDDBF41